MFRKVLVRLGLLCVIVLSVSGCAINRATATIDPSANLASIKSIHVTKFAPDERGVNLVIANKLRTMGYTVSTGLEKPANVDAVATYVDKWMWDITMYMLELTITIRDPKNDFPLASGNSFHTSLTRKSVEEMVDEVTNNIFKKGAEDVKK